MIKDYHVLQRSWALLCEYLWFSLEFSVNNNNIGVISMNFFLKKYWWTFCQISAENLGPAIFLMLHYIYSTDKFVPSANRQHMCCDNHLIIFEKDTNVDLDCCGPRIFETESEICCDGTVRSKDTNGCCETKQGPSTWDTCTLFDFWGFQNNNI